MVGDGANDAAALQAATAGLALLARAREGPGGNSSTRNATPTEPWSPAEARVLAPIFEREMRSLRLAGHPTPGAKALERVEDLRRRKAAGGSGAFALGALVDALLGHGAEATSGMGDVGSSFEVGEASMAAPFSSRRGSPLSVVDVVCHGRAALEHAVQGRCMLALEGMAAALSLSALYLRGVRFAQAQLLAGQAVGTVCGAATAFPLLPRTLEKRRVVSSVLEPRVGVSLLGQALVHLGTMIGALAISGAPVDVAVVEALGGAAGEEEPSRQFQPSPLNTAVFLLSICQLLSTTLVNAVRVRTDGAGSLMRTVMRITEGATILLAVGAVPMATERLRLDFSKGRVFQIQLAALVLLDRSLARLADDIAARLYPL